MKKINIDELRTHYKVKATLDRLDRWRPIVAAGFISFWLVWGVALLYAIYHVIAVNLF